MTGCSEIRRLPGRRVFAIVAAALLSGFVATAWAGGTPENALLIIDPTSSESLYLGNYYRSARNIPERNVLYMAPGAADYSAFVAVNQTALFGALANAGVGDHVDYVVLTPGSPFFIAAPGLVGDQCWPVARFSTPSAYTFAYISSIIQAGTQSTLVNQYYGGDARAFSSNTRWLGGAPSGAVSARQYFISALLGYSGARGNSLAETLAMIDRSVAADGTRPPGTYYFMKTTDAARSGPRDPFYSAVANAIVTLGGQAQVLEAVLPSGRSDCLGIMTGWADLDIPGANLTILPGAYCDHLTSWAATFDNAAQTKVSAWITNGASGSWGTVEEPCNYPGKFPHARLHQLYFQGLSLGEAAFRSVAYAPFQGLIYGDPLTRPFAYLPVVNVAGVPTLPVSGTITLTPSGSTAEPGAQVSSFTLLVDGVTRGTASAGGVFTLDTTQLADGWHDLRVLGAANTLVRSTGRWLGGFTVANHDHTAAIQANTASGNGSTPFEFTVTTAGGSAREVRVLQNGRIVAAATGAAASLTVHGAKLGAGPGRVQAEAYFADGSFVRSAPLNLSISYAAGTPVGLAPMAYGYRKALRADQPCVVELPATSDDPNQLLNYEVVQAPTKATVVPGPSGPYRLLRPVVGAKGLDTLLFRAYNSAGSSAVVTVTLDFGVRPGDLNCDGSVNFADINPFVQVLANPSAWQAAFPTCAMENGDTNGDGLVDFGDINGFVALLAG